MVQIYLCLTPKCTTPIVSSKGKGNTRHIHACMMNRTFYMHNCLQDTWQHDPPLQIFFLENKKLSLETFLITSGDNHRSNTHVSPILPLRDTISFVPILDTINFY
jgi:hypothetical protein